MLLLTVKTVISVRSGGKEYMRSEDVNEKNYQKVARVLRRAKNYYFKVADIAELTGLTKEQARAGIPRAKKILDGEGIIIVNKMQAGYRHGSYEDFEIEAAKACLRSYANLNSILKRTERLKKSRAIINDHSIRDIMSNTQISLRGIIKRPEDFLDEKDYADYLSKLRVTPDFLETALDA